MLCNQSPPPILLVDVFSGPRVEGDAFIMRAVNGDGMWV